MKTADLLRALDCAEAGEWAEAHRIVQTGDDPLSAWVHAHLHREEGDAANAGYWYARAGRAPAEGALADERAAIRFELVQGSAD